jgi:hypothetical protein
VALAVGKRAARRIVKPRQQCCPRLVEPAVFVGEIRIGADLLVARRPGRMQSNVGAMKLASDLPAAATSGVVESRLLLAKKLPVICWTFRQCGIRVRT